MQTHHKNSFLDGDEFLLCDEVWEISPVHDHANRNRNTFDNNIHHSIHPITKQDVKHRFDTCLQKEVKYMTGSGYINLLHSNHFVADCRLKAIHWFIHRQRRFDFCIGTVFNAVNYVDRFIDTNKCQGFVVKGWSYWMMELLSLAALSIAVKFGETCPPSLHEIKEGLEYSFEAKLIQKMEMKILKSLGWEVNSVTPYSYVELIEWELNRRNFKPVVRSRLDEILLASSLDFKFLEYRPCVIAVSGFKCILEDEDCVSHITSFIPTDENKNIKSCYNKMQEILVGYQKSELNRNPSSPDTVLTKELQVPVSEAQIDEPAAMKNKVKRRRVDDHDHDHA